MEAALLPCGVGSVGLSASQASMSHHAHRRSLLLPTALLMGMIQPSSRISPQSLLLPPVIISGENAVMWIMVRSEREVARWRRRQRGISATFAHKRYIHAVDPSMLERCFQHLSGLTLGRRAWARW